MVWNMARLNLGLALATLALAAPPLASAWRCATASAQPRDGCSRRHGAIRAPPRALPIAAAVDKRRAGKKLQQAAKGFGAQPPSSARPSEAAPPSDRRAGGAPPAPLAQSSPGWAALRPWLEARGATVNGVAVGVVDAASGLRGVVASRAFERGEPIFKVPREAAILDEARADASPVGAVWAGRAAEVPACVRVALLVLFLQAKAGADGSAHGGWGPALAMLPSRSDFEAEGGPLELWSEAQVAACDCGQLVGEVGARSAELAALYAEVLLPGWQRAAAAPGSPLAPHAPPPFEVLQWAVVAVSSRAYGEGPAGGGASSMLVPGVDLCNHAPPAQANTAKALAPWGEFVVIAARRISAGEQVCISYGPLPNRRLLQQFGFMLPDTCAGQAELDVALARIDRLWAAPGAGAGGAAELPAPARPALDELARAGLLLAGKDGAVSLWQPCGAKLRAAVERLERSAGAAPYAELLRRELAAFPSGPDPRRDEAELRAAAAELSPRARLAADFRARAKRLLLAALDDAA